jgi:hypothetical protein
MLNALTFAYPVKPNIRHVPPSKPPVTSYIHSSIVTASSSLNEWPGRLIPEYSIEPTNERE